MKVALVPAVLAFAAFLQPLLADPPESHFEFTSGIPSKLVFTTEPGHYYDVKATGDLSQPFQQVDHFPQMHDGGTLEHVIAPDVRQFFIIEYNVAPDPGGFAWIPGGSFQMGDSLGDGFSDELPVHTVTVDGFYMQRAEVTNDEMVEALNWAYGQGKLVVSTSTVQNSEGDQQELLDLDEPECRISWNGSQFVMKSAKGSGYPCVEVTWYGSASYANYRSEMDGLTPCYNLSDWSCNYAASGYRLPTEAEWEYAARGGLSGQRFPWGATIDHDRANYRANGSAYSYDVSPYTSYTYYPDWDDGEYPYTSPAGTFAPNGYGLYDMAGNVWEWCGDWYGLYPSGSVNNPTGPSSGSIRVFRGGSWSGSAFGCRVAFRFSPYPDGSYSHIGFRLLRR